jgi:hypothetical protein
MSKLRSGLTYANVMATIAVFVALGGGAYAALRVPKNSVGSKQLKANAVNSSKVKNGSLLEGDFKAGQLPAGPQGPKGVQGDKGDPCLPSDPACQGPKGDPGPPATNAAHANTADTATNAGNADTLDNIDSTAFALAGAEPWNDAALNNGFSQVACFWMNYGGSQNGAGYFRDRAGIVHLKGLVTAHDGVTFACGAQQGTNAVVLTLPAGYRPDHDWAIATISNDKPGRMNVNPAGAVSIEDLFPDWPDAYQWVSLDGLTFRCAPSGQDGCP